MMIYGGLVLGGLVVLALAACAGAADAPPEVVRNGDFAAAGEGALPAAWAFWGPAWEKARPSVRKVAGGLLVESPREPYAVGGVAQDLVGVKGGQAYAVEVEAEAQGLPAPERSLIVRLSWTRGRELVHPAGMLVRRATGGAGGLPASASGAGGTGGSPTSGRDKAGGTGGSPASASGAGGTGGLSTSARDKAGGTGGLSTSARDKAGGTGGLPASAAGRTLDFKDIFIAPPEADGAKLSLEVKWPQGGTVVWKRASVRPAAPPPPRKVKVGTVYLRPSNTTPDRNVEFFAAKVDEAGKLGLDIVCLGESIRVVGTGKAMHEVAEPVPGPSTERLGAAARKNRLWVVAGLTERDGDRLYNTAVLLDREGRLAGTYRKVHLPREEWHQGIVPGGEYPVFRTDFGTIAIQICYDWFFPEAAANFALRGAEILFAPTWGDTLADQDGRAGGETVFRTRARDNGLYLVPSVYDGQSMIIDPMGRILASNKGKEGVFWAEIDLAKRECLPWVGWWRSIGPLDRMPETYGRMTERK